MNRYPAYRPSGVESLGDVPEHWDVKRLDHVASYQTSSVDKKVEVGEIPVRLCNYTDVYYKDRIRVSQGDFMEATATPREIASCRLEPGDVVITKDSEDWQDIGIPALVDETADDFVCGYHLGIIRPRRGLHSSFLFRLMQSGAVNQRLQTSASGVTRYGLSNSAVTDVTLSLPPLAEQRVIAAFLDQETERIDALVAKNQHLIERLQEYRTALITRTMTGGLPPDAARAAGFDPSPRLKPSGVERLGDVPEHWGIRRLKDVGHLISGAAFPEALQGVSGEELPFYKVADLDKSRDGRLLKDAEHTISREAAAEIRARIVPQESVVYAKIGAALLLNRRRVNTGPACIDNNMSAYVPDRDRITTHWALYTLSVLDFGEHVNPGAVPSLSEGDQAILPLPIPPLDEQRAIAEYLEQETERIDALVAKNRQLIERLHEYRTALITAAVTGKVDVREPVAAHGLLTGVVYYARHDRAT